MPYIYCPGCRLLLYSAAAHSTADRCPRCDAPLARSPDPSVGSAGCSSATVAADKGRGSPCSWLRDTTGSAALGHGGTPLTQQPAVGTLAPCWPRSSKRGQAAEVSQLTHFVVSN
jgi:hypothetical protein